VRGVFASLSPDRRRRRARAPCRALVRVGRHACRIILRARSEDRTIEPRRDPDATNSAAGRNKKKTSGVSSLAPPAPRRHPPRTGLPHRVSHVHTSTRSLRLRSLYYRARPPPCDYGPCLARHMESPLGSIGEELSQLACATPLAILSLGGEERATGLTATHPSRRRALTSGSAARATAHR
jgi:hypothetical protein